MEDNDGEIRQARLAIKREEADEVAQERQAVIDKAKREKDRLSTDVVSPPRNPHIGAESICRCMTGADLCLLSPSTTASMKQWESIASAGWMPGHLAAYYSGWSAIDLERLAHSMMQ